MGLSDDVPRKINGEVPSASSTSIKRGAMLNSPWTSAASLATTRLNRGQSDIHSQVTAKKVIVDQILNENTIAFDDSKITNVTYRPRLLHVQYSET